MKCVTSGSISQSIKNEISRSKVKANHNLIFKNLMYNHQYIKEPK